MSYNKETLALARVIHIAKIEDCYFPNSDNPTTSIDAAMRREPWPTDRKEFARLQQAGQPWIEIAIAQAVAVQKHLEQS